MLIKVEEVEIDGCAMYKEYYGPDEKHVTATILGGGPQDQEKVNQEYIDTLEKKKFDINDVMAELLLNQAIIMEKLQKLEGD